MAPFSAHSDNDNNNINIQNTHFNDSVHYEEEEESKYSITFPFTLKETFLSTRVSHSTRHCHSWKKTLKNLNKNPKKKQSEILMSKKSKSIDDRIHEDVLKDFQWNLTSNPKKSLRSFQRVRWTIKGIPNRNF